MLGADVRNPGPARPMGRTPDHWKTSSTRPNGLMARPGTESSNPSPSSGESSELLYGTGGLGIGRRLHRADGTRRAQSVEARVQMHDGRPVHSRCGTNGSNPSPSSEMDSNFQYAGAVNLLQGAELRPAVDDPGGVDRRHRDDLFEQEAQTQELAHDPSQIGHARRIAGNDVERRSCRADSLARWWPRPPYPFAYVVARIVAAHQ